MHAEAWAFVAQAVRERGPFERVLELGGRNVNGSVRDLFFGADYTAVDIAPGAGVDIVADCCEWQPPARFDAVVCCEVFEHEKRWPMMCATAARACRPGGVAVLTMAGPGRAPHSAIDGGTLRPDEWYDNVDPDALLEALTDAGFSFVDVEHNGPDVYAVAVI